jgi:hypothetical protein
MLPSTSRKFIREAAVLLFDYLLAVYAKNASFSFVTLCVSEKY